MKCGAETDHKSVYGLHLSMKFKLPNKAMLRNF
jgi:hypothetical protein